MKTSKLCILLCICFSFNSFSKGTRIPIGAFQNYETEADFNFECSECKTNDVFPFKEDQIECLQTVYSKECKRIPAGDRKTCTSQDALKATDTSAFLSQCIKETALSFQFVFELLWYGITASTSWMFDSEEDNSSSQNYIYLEFYKAYLKAKGSKLERTLKAAEIVGKETFNLLWANIKEFLITEYKSLKCYNSRAKTTLACVFVAGLFVPVPGASFLGILKTGAKASGKFLKHPKKTSSSLTKTLQVKNIKKHLRSNFDNIKTNVLKKSKNLTKNQKNKILQFFNRVDKEKFINLISRKLKETGRSAISKESIRNAVVASLTVGSAHAIQLSQKSAFAIAEGVTDTVAIEYIYKEVM